jgi:hypothetical protein
MHCTRRPAAPGSTRCMTCCSATRRRGAGYGPGAARVTNGGARVRQGQPTSMEPGPGMLQAGRAGTCASIQSKRALMYSGAARRTGFLTFSPSAHRYSYCAPPAQQSLASSEQQRCDPPHQLSGTKFACATHGSTARLDQVRWANGALAPLANLATSGAGNITAAGAWRRSPALPSAAPRRRGARLRPGRHLRAARARAELGQRAVQDGDRVVEVDRVHRQPLVQVLARRQLDRLAHAPAAQRRVDVPLEREALARRAAAGRGSAVRPAKRGACGGALTGLGAGRRHRRRARPQGEPGW